MSKMFYETFEDYLLDYPGIEKYRIYLTAIEAKKIGKSKNNIPRIIKEKKVCFIKTQPHHNGFCGDYFSLEINHNFVTIKDCDDCCLKIYSDNINDVINSIKELLPITMKDLIDFFSQEHIEY